MNCVHLSRMKLTRAALCAGLGLALKPIHYARDLSSAHAPRLLRATQPRYQASHSRDSPRHTAANLGAFACDSTRYTAANLGANRPDSLPVCGEQSRYMRVRFHAHSCAIPRRYVRVVIGRACPHNARTKHPYCKPLGKPYCNPNSKPIC
jgi:hypothetical protein